MTKRTISLALLATGGIITVAIVLSWFLPRSPSRSTLMEFQPKVASKRAIEYQDAVRRARQVDPPVLQFLTLDERDRSLVERALGALDLLTWSRDPRTGQALRNEIMAVRPVKVGDLPEGIESKCVSDDCRVVELFNFSLNVLTIGVYSSGGELLSLRHLHDIQPEVPEHLTALAYELASIYPPLLSEIGHPVDPSSFIMGGTKSALAGTTCDRSRTLCVSATLVRDGFAYWVIVNLEDMTVVGMRRTKWEDGNPEPISEASLRDSAIMEQLCTAPQTYSQGQWKFSYGLTSSDGARVSSLTFKGEELLREATNVDWHVSYSGTDGFGYSDAVFHL